MKFSPDFSSAETPAGETIKFTRSEARALSYLAKLPGKVVTRNQLLDAVSEPGSDKNDRSVDFLVNRIRRKLKDDAKNPKFIASRYGEGYIWQSEWSSYHVGTPKVFAVIGPIRWPQSRPELETTAMKFARQLLQDLEAQVLDDQKLDLNPTFERTEVGGAMRPEFMVEISVIGFHPHTEVVVTTKEFEQGSLIDAQRISYSQDTCETVLPPDDLVPDVLAKIWKRKANRPSDVPLPVAMHDVVPSEDKSEISWNEADRRIKRLRQLHPEDAELKIMQAAHLHTKYTLLGPDLFMKGEDTCPEDEAEIERLVLEALPYIEDRPELMAYAGKYLHFLKKGYDNRAVDLAESAHSKASNVGSTLGVIGQLRSFRGDFAGAKECFEQAKMFSKPGSEFHVYLLVMMIQMYLASDDKEGLAKAKAEMYSAKPATMVFFEPILTDPEKPSLRARAAVMMLSRKRAQGLLKHSFYISGSMFDHQEHRENMMRTFATLMRRRFGREIFTDKMRELLPNLTG